LKAIPQTAFKKCRVPEKILNLARTEEIDRKENLERKKFKKIKKITFHSYSSANDEPTLNSLPVDLFQVQ
jgi:hypothetical protein